MAEVDEAEYEADGAVSPTPMAVRMALRLRNGTPGKVPLQPLRRDGRTKSSKLPQPKAKTGDGDRRPLSLRPTSRMRVKPLQARDLRTVLWQTRARETISQPLADGETHRHQRNWRRRRGMVGRVGRRRLRNRYPLQSLLLV